MCSYNRINLVWACENNVTLNEELKGYFNYSGWVMSDWGATHSTVPSALAGLDQEMPSDDFFSVSAFTTALEAGDITHATIDDKVYRILTSMFTIGLFDNPNTGNIMNNVTSTEHNQLARELAGQAAVLLLNNGILPLDSTAELTYAIIGNAAYNGVITGGGGSGDVVPYYRITPLSGIASRLANGGVFRNSTCVIETGFDYFQKGSPTSPGSSPEDCCTQCNARATTCNAWTFQDGTCFFKSSNFGKIPVPGFVSGYCATPDNVIFNDGLDLTLAAQDAAAADIAIVVVATYSAEGTDRINLSFPGQEDALVAAVAAVQPNTIVVMVNPGAVLTPWADDVDAIVAMFMPGQEEGNALADVLFGDVEPGGRLPITFPNVENEVQFTKEQWPGLPEDHPLNSEYSEMLEIGYRWYQSHGVIPKFAFGHGLSYTTFEYSDLVVAGRNVSFTVTNTGSRAGYEVPQMYLAFPASAGEPPLQLKGFTKVSLAPGQTAPVVFTVTDRDLAIWDVSANAFVAQSGVFGVSVGASSQNILLTGSLVN